MHLDDFDLQELENREKSRIGDKKIALLTPEPGLWAQEPNARRIELVDELRGVCVLCMVCYHAFFILGTQFDVAWGLALYTFFRPAQPAFAALFILISGFCARLSRDVKKRAFLLTGIAVSISVLTMLVLPALGFEDMKIEFGVLHLLAASTLLFGFGKKFFDIIPALPGVILCLGLFFFFAPVSQDPPYLGMLGFRIELPQALCQTNALFFLGFHNPDFASWDYFPLLPYMFIFLFGTYVGKLTKNDQAKTKLLRLEDLPLPNFCYRKHSAFFGLLGRHALPIYLLHVPVFYGLFYLARGIASLGA